MQFVFILSNYDQIKIENSITEAKDIAKMIDGAPYCSLICSYNL